MPTISINESINARDLISTIEIWQPLGFFPAYNKAGKHLTRDSQGAIYIASYNTTLHRVQMEKSLNEGYTWVTLDAAAAPTDCEMGVLTMVIDSTGLIHIIYKTSLNRLQYTQFNTNSGTWETLSEDVTGTDIIFEYLAGRDVTLSIAIDNNNKPHILWVDSTVALGSPFSLYYSNRISGSWSTPMEIMDQAGRIGNEIGRASCRERV